MNFKEALIAHLQGENVEVEGAYGWVEFPGVSGLASLAVVIDGDCEHVNCRLAPPIIVNGVEVPTPERFAPKIGEFVFVADPASRELYFGIRWAGSDMHKEYLERELVYIKSEHAIARAKAMLIVKEG